MAKPIELEERKEAKAAVSQRLAAVNLTKYRLSSVDSRLYSYVKEVCVHPDRHNLWEQLAVERFLRLVDKYGLDKGAILAFYTFYEKLKFPGNAGPTQYKLTPVQCFQFASVYGFKREDGKRLTRRAILFVPRKFSKTTSSAAIVLWDLIFGESNAQSYIAANSAKQAKNCFDIVRKCLFSIDPEQKHFIINKQDIESLWGERTATAHCLTANANTKDGLNASSIVMDEFSQAKDASLLNVLTTSMGVREEPLTVIITTASELFDGPFYDMLQGYKHLLLGHHEDDTTFAHLFEPDAGDDEGDPNTWRKVHPHLGVTVTHDFYASEWAEAQRTGAEAMLAFRTKLLNVFTAPEYSTWLTRRQIDEVSKPFDLSEVTNGDWECRIGVDLSDVDDFSALTACYRNPETAQFIYKTDYFFPEGALNSHPNAELYRKWASEGYLHLTPGDVVNYDAIINTILTIADQVSVLSIGYDARGATDFANHLRDLGFGNFIFPIPQTYGYFTAPVFFLEKSVKQGNATFDSNPINLFCFGNCVMGQNGDGRKPEKKSHNLKIDGVISALMAARQYLYPRKQ